MTEPNGDLQAIASEIIAMSEADQKMRKGGVWDASLDVKHTARMQHIIQRLAGPRFPKLGRLLRGVHGCWSSTQITIWHSSASALLL